MKVQSPRSKVQGRLLVRRILLLSCFLAGPWTSADAAARPRYGDTLRLSFSQTAETYDPAQAATLPERLLARSIYETLTSLLRGNRTGAGVEGRLAASWRAEAGGRRWIFNLRPGARFHSGNALTAAAARAAVERAVTRAQTAAAAQLRALQFVCSSPDPARLVCDLSEPLPVLPEMLADPALAIADADGSGTGPWKMGVWVAGTRARLEAFDDYWAGRPFLDAIEAEFGVEARRQRVEFELKRAEVLANSPAEARPPGTARPSPAVSLLLLGVPAKSALLAGDGAAACRALSEAIDREALARLLPPGVAAAAFGLLPGWLSGYESLFGRPPDKPQPAAGLPRVALRLIHDASDPVARLIASRLTFDFRALGVELRVDSLAHAAYAAARESAPHDLYLESARLRTAAPGVALADLLQRYQLKGEIPGLFVVVGPPETRAEAQYRIEREALETARAIPVLHYRDVYSFQPGLEQVRLDESGFLDLANAWKK